MQYKASILILVRLQLLLSTSLDKPQRASASTRGTLLVTLRFIYILGVITYTIKYRIYWT